MTQTGQRVVARPIRSARIAWGAAVFVLVVFVVTSIVMTRYNAGSHFGIKDQFSTALIGVVLAGLCIMPTRPRLEADHDSVRLRSFLGGWRTVPWDVIVRVEFPKSVRFARLVLPADETLAIYAVQRFDQEHAVTVMRQLRALAADVAAQQQAQREAQAAAESGPADGARSATEDGPTG